MLEVQNIKYSYNKDYQALKGVSLKVEKGEMVALLGKNGAGKSTTLQTISGLLKAKSGKITFCGEDISHVVPHKIVEKFTIMLYNEYEQNFPVRL